QGEKKHYPWVTTILDSQQYVNVKTGKFTTATLGSLGIESYLGTAFIALNGAERDNAGSLILNGNNLPIVGIAQSWVPGAVDYSSSAAVTRAFVKQLTSSNVAESPLIKVDEEDRDGIKTYVMNGEVSVNNVKIVCYGLAFVFEEHAASVILLYDPKDKEALSTANEIIKSIKPVKEDSF